MIGEVKFENTISRTTGIANPRQIERVPAGAVFAFKLVYNVENLGELEEDMNLLAKGFQLLQTDYLGGHGSRGYGRVKLSTAMLFDSMPLPIEVPVLLRPDPRTEIGSFMPFSAN